VERTASRRIAPRIDVVEQGLRDEIDIRRERAIVASVLAREDEHDPDPLAELRALADTAGVRVVGELSQRRSKPDPHSYLGKGKVEALAAMVQELGAKVVLLDNDLSPSQLQALEEAVKCKVLDRSELVLDIFAGRATTRAAQLQVEIAQLEYTAPRLRAMWSHLGQVTGGAPMGVGTRGPGEKQIEIDRRLVQRRLSQLKRELAEVQLRRTREVASRRADHFTVGIVGYTNAGKSSLFNALTAGGAFANDQLFATLHTRVESWQLGGGESCLLSDTVGFIRRLPHHLVASFRSTLEDAIAAHVLLILLDAGDPHAERQLGTVKEVLDEIGAGEQPRIVVLNKLDRVAAQGAEWYALTDRERARLSGSVAEAPDDGFEGDDEPAARTGTSWAEYARVHGGIADPRERLERLRRACPGAIEVSARTGEGLDALADAVRAQMLGPVVTVRIRLPLLAGKAVDMLEKRGHARDRDYGDDGTVTLTADLARRHVEVLLAQGVKAVIDGEPAAIALKRIWPVDSTGLAARIPLHERLFGA
jgi:GTP-binding protein HflX